MHGRAPYALALCALEQGQPAGKRRQLAGSEKWMGPRFGRASRLTCSGDRRTTRNRKGSGISGNAGNQPTTIGRRGKGKLFIPPTDAREYNGVRHS